MSKLVYLIEVIRGIYLKGGKYNGMGIFNYWYSRFRIFLLELVKNARYFEGLD